MTETCPRCGAEQPRDAPGGLCPRCLAQTGMDLCLREAQALNPGDEQKAGSSAPIGPVGGEAAAASMASRSFGDYELLEEIGRGGMGVVYRARQRSLDRVVAIKLMAFGPGSSPELVKRFRAEAMSAASLHHPNIVAIHDVGIHEGRHFFVMDCVEGQSLARLAGNQPLPAKRAAAYLQAIAEAVHYAHERGILHRDLKPSNVLIDAEDHPHVVDFGLARQLQGDSELTVTGQVLGSPNYLPPEQAVGQRTRISRHSDVYALGATLYHLLTGRPPFQAESLAQTLDLVLHTDPVAPRLLNPGVPRDLETICLKCLEKEPSRRYATAQELADELTRFQLGEPIRARPLGPARKAGRWCRRKPQVAGLAAVAILSVLLGFSGVLWQWREARRSAAAEVQQRRRAVASESSLQRRVYIAEINSAQQALRANNPRRALELLNRHRPVEKSEKRNPKSELGVATDLRGFEWRYLWQQCQSEAETVIGKLPSRIRSLEVSADGQWLFAGSQGGEPRLWNLFTGEHVLVAGEADWSWGAFSPDSRLLLFCAETVESYGRILVWDLQARKQLKPILDPRPIATMAFSVDGRWFGFGVHQPPWGRGLVVWDFSARQKVNEIIALTPMEGLDFGWDWGFTRDGRSVIGSENNPDRRIFLCDLTPGSEPRYSPGHREPISAMAISPDGQLLATGAGYTDTGIKLWEVPSLRPLGELTNHQGWITALRFSPDGQTLASAGADQTCRLWDVATRTTSRVFDRLPSDVLRLRFSPDGKKLFTGSRDGTVERWSLTAQPVRPQPAVWPKPPGLGEMVLAPDAKRFAALQNGEVYLGEIEGLTPPRRLGELGTNSTCLLFSSDGESLFAGGRSGQVQVWRLGRRQVERSLRGGAEPVNRLCQDPHGHVLVVAQMGDDFAAGRPYPRMHIVIWDTTEWRQTQPYIAPLRGGDLISTDGRWLALNTSSLAEPIRVWGVSHSPETNGLSFPGEVSAIAFSSDGRFLAAGNAAGRVKVWEVPTFRELKELQAHAYPVSAVAFSPETRRLATAAEVDEAVKLWDVDTGQELITLQNPRGHVDQLLFTADGNAVIAKSSRGDLLFWRAPSSAEIARLESQRAAPK